MVNAAKRMRLLADKLYHIRNGPGSVLLPAAPKPQLKAVHIRLPTGVFPTQAHYYGGREFWRNHLRRLKYYNPSLSCKVDTIRDGTGNEPMYLTATYEASDRRVLEQINNSFPRALHQPREKSSESDKEKKSSKPNDNFEGTPILMTEVISAHAPKSDIKTVIPTQNTAKDAPSQIFQRTLTLPLHNVRSTEIWSWMRQHMSLPYEGREVPKEEVQERKQLEEFWKSAEVERQRVKKGIEAMRKEQAELKKAREAADRMAEAA